MNVSYSVAISSTLYIRLFIRSTNETSPYIDEKAIVGKTSNEFGKKFLLLREFAPENLDYEKPNIEDIMLFYVKGDK